jgi:methanogenic corrinoid protein MtbC1
MADAGVEAAGKVCIGTVKGDLHDIGKNLVKMMMEGKGLEVVDLGTDVAPETYVQTAVEQGCQIICPRHLSQLRQQHHPDDRFHSGNRLRRLSFRQRH